MTSSDADNDDDPLFVGDCRDDSETESDIHDTSAVTMPHDRPEPEPEFIGPYRLLSPLGEGGMGQVFVAQQKKPIRRKVALKIIKPGMDSKEILTRFEAERQAVALMDHTNIARVYDAGTTNDGRPYFVMELVEGKPLTEFCDQKKLSLKQRLDLFRQVCHAVQHAHQKGIIHRDLKPSNILVTIDPDKDDRPVPKIIDFGVAKALGSSLTENTLFTLAGQVIGTPQYMSPEQAALDATDVDTRADIYSLGILLYELLTGRTPLEMAELRKAGLEEVLRTIREKDAERPSTRLSALEDETRADIAEARQVPLSKLTQSLRGDLDWIVMKSLEKERSRRYETANAFAADIQRYQKDEPVLASPPSQAYKFGKFARRNKGLLFAAAAVVVVLIAGMATTAWQAKHARIEQQRAEVARADAEKLVGFMLNDLRSKLSEIGKLELMEKVEDAVLSYYESAPNNDGSYPEEAQRADSLIAASRTLSKKGRRSEAVQRAEQAVAIRRSLFDRQPENLAFRTELVRDLSSLSDFLMANQIPEQAMRLREEAYELLRAVPTAELDDSAALLLGYLLRVRAHDLTDRLHRGEEAKSAALEALELALKQTKGAPESIDWQEELAYAVSICDLVGASPETLWERYENPGTFTEILDQILAEHPEDYERKAMLLTSLREQLWNEQRQEIMERGLALSKDLIEHDPDNVDWLLAAANFEARAGVFLFHRTRIRTAIEHTEEAARLYRECHDRNAESSDMLSSYGYTLSNLGFYWDCLRENSEEARNFHQRAVDLYEESVALDPNSASEKAMLCMALLRLAKHAAPNEKETVARRAFETGKEAYEMAPNLEVTRGYFYWSSGPLAALCLQSGKLDEAEEINNQALEVARIIQGYRMSAATLRFKGKLAMKRGQREEALAHFKASAEIHRERMENGRTDQTYNDPGTIARDIALDLIAILTCFDPPAPEAVAYVQEAVAEVEDGVSRMNPSVDNPDRMADVTANLLERLASQAAATDHLKSFQSYAGRIVELRLTLAEGPVSDDSRERLLDALGHDIHRCEMIAREHGLAPSLTRDTALGALARCEKLAMPLATSPGLSRANLVPADLCRILSRVEESEGNRTQAIAWLEKAETRTTAVWEDAVARNQVSADLSFAMREIAKELAELGEQEAAVSAFVTTMHWRRDLADHGEANRLKHLWDLAIDADGLVKLMGRWKRDRRERLPYLQVRAEAVVEAFEFGDREHIDRALVWLDDLGATERGCGEIESARSRFQKVRYIAENLREEESETLTPNASGRIARSRECEGELAEEEKEWKAAESHYLASLEAWGSGEAELSNVSGRLMSNRIKIRLARLFEKSGRETDPQFQQWCREVNDTLHPLAKAGTLPASLKWVYEFAQKKDHAPRKEVTLD